MKTLKPLAFLLFTLILSCKAQQNDLQEMKKSPGFFMSQWTGGNQDQGFVILKNNKDLTRFINGQGGTGKVVIARSSDESEPIKKYKIPRGQVVVFYSFGMKRSGQFTAKGIDSLKLKNKILELFLTKERESPQQGGFEPKIQVISYPWMAFSIPETWKFDSIQIN